MMYYVICKASELVIVVAHSLFARFGQEKRLNQCNREKSRNPMLFLRATSIPGAEVGDQAYAIFKATKLVMVQEIRPGEKLKQYSGAKVLEFGFPLRATFLGADLGDDEGVLFQAAKFAMVLTICLLGQPGPEKS